MTPEARRAYLTAMGIQTWGERGAASGDGAKPSVSPVATTSCPVVATVSETALSPGVTTVAPISAEIGAAPQLGGVGELDWDSLRAAVRGCTKCGLHTTRTQAVFGVGSRSADLMIVGEAPGADEDRQGEPFVGRAGQLLNAMLRAIGLGREQVYIANILKCRPPGNRDPQPEEALCCEPYLQRQIELVKPRVLLAAGRVAAQNLLKSTENVGRLRAGEHRLHGIPLVVTYHPAYLLRSPEEKAKAWQDLQRLARMLR